VYWLRQHIWIKSLLLPIKVVIGSKSIWPVCVVVIST